MEIEENKISENNNLFSTSNNAILALENGYIFSGVGIGSQNSVCGEVIFNSTMLGYQEVISDPSYAGQIITFSCSHIGNVGINRIDAESQTPLAKGIVIRNLSSFYNNWRAEGSIENYLKDNNITGIAGIDTRALVRIIRTYGSLKGAIVGYSVSAKDAVKMAQAHLNVKHSVECVTTKNIYSLGNSNNHFHIVIYDLGVKESILNILIDLGCELTIVPSYTPAELVMSLKPDGVLLSNGPGDPQDCTETILATRIFLENEIPLFGLCLGHQILALACGGKTFKMKFGHHGANHPIFEIKTGKVLIGSQNHCFAVEECSLPEILEVTHFSLFDNTIQGICHRSKPAMGFQGHPEASPGPHDLQHLFKGFLSMIALTSQKNSLNTIKNYYA